MRTVIMGRTARRRRRRLMAKAVRLGKTQCEVAKEFRVSQMTVSMACREFGAKRGPAVVLKRATRAPQLDFARAVRLAKAHRLPAKPAVYRILNMVTGESYIGASYDVRERAVGHMTRLRSGSNRSLALQRSFVLHGEAAFVVKVIEFGEGNALWDRENYWIETLKPAFNRYQIRPRVLLTPKRPTRADLTVAT